MEQKLLLFGVLFIIIMIGCYMSKQNNSKKCRKRRRRCRESYTQESYGTDTQTNVLQTTATGDLSAIDINPIIKGFIDGKSADTSASFSIKELTATGNVKGSSVYGNQLCIGTTCLTEADLKNLKMITTSSLTAGDISLLKGLGTGANMQMNGNQLGSMTTANGGSYAFPSYDTGSGYQYPSGTAKFKFSV